MKDAKQIGVDVKGSDVTLSGTVHSWSERDLANQAAWAAPGVPSRGYEAFILGSLGVVMWLLWIFVSRLTEQRWPRVERVTAWLVLLAAAATVWVLTGWSGWLYLALVGVGLVALALVVVDEVGVAGDDAGELQRGYKIEGGY